MNIGKPKRRHTVEPVENPPQKQPVSVPAK
jgi:hypothetical protein